VSQPTHHTSTSTSDVSMSSYSYKVVRETSTPRGSYSTTYSTPSYASPSRSYHSTYMTPSRTTRYVVPPRTTSYTSYAPPSYSYSPSSISYYSPRGDSERVVKRVEERVYQTSTKY